MTDSTETLTVTVVGLSPLLMNNFTAMKPASEPKATVTHIPLPEEEAESKVYRTPDGVLYVPAVAFRGAMFEGAKYQKVGRMAGTALVKAGVFALHENALLFDPATGKPITEYDIDIRRVVIPGRGAVMRARPRIEEWACEVTFGIDPVMFADVELARGFLERGGRMSGVGDFRPQKSGPFGRFTIKD